MQTIEHYNPVTNKTIRFQRQPRGKRITLGGDGYLFACRLIQTLSNAELDMIAEYHRAMLGLIVNEQEIKKAEKAHKVAGVKIPTPSTILSTPKGVAKTTVTSTTKTTVSKMSKAREQAKAALFAMYKGVLTMEQIDALLDAQKAGGGK